MAIKALAVVFLILNTCSAVWDETQVAQIARAIADERNLKCYAVCHGGGHQVHVFRVAKALQLEENFRLVRILTFDGLRSGLALEGCSQSLFILLAWLPEAGYAFEMVRIRDFKFALVFLYIFGKFGAKIQFNVYLIEDQVFFLNF